MKALCIICFQLSLAAFFSAKAQDFAYGSVGRDELTMTQYAGDTSASAVVLKEFGQAHISNGDYTLIFRYHVRIKVLNKNGVNQSNIEIPLYKRDNNRFETVSDIKASSFNLDGGRVKEEVLVNRNIMREDRNKYYKIEKFAIPNVRAGSVIEYSYTITSPFIFNFRGWEFQADIPKVESEYWASVPGIYLYNITLRGYQKLSKKETKIVKGCLGVGDGRTGYSADCALMQYAMKNIPAFVEEDYMTAKKNFLSAIHFELSEVRHFDGRVDKVTKEWKDAEEELRQDSRFGVQLKKGKDIAEEVASLIAEQTDDLEKAKTVYDFIKGWYLWNGTYGMFSESGIRKAFVDRKGNIGDINLSLIAALRFAGLDVEPVILSTRDNGLAVELHPVLSEFNYVVAKVNIGDKSYLADASVDYYPFGMLPKRCINGKGRVIGDKESYWVELKPTTTGKNITVLSLALTSDGIMRGTLQTTYFGYAAADERQKVIGFVSPDEYFEKLQDTFGPLRITNREFEGLDDIEKPLIRKLAVEMTAFDDIDASNFLFNPFIHDKWDENPFKSRERLYPVDFGVPQEQLTVLNLEYPGEFELVNLPEKVGLSLPNAGGHYLFEAKNADNKLSINNSFSIRKTVYSSHEYHYLKELFAQILQVQNGELIFRKKT